MRDAELAEATISKRVKTARQIFRQGVRWKMLAENPFADVKAGSQTNKARMYFVSREDAQKVLDACPDAQWKLLFALSRYGGLRCPSEHLMLKWADVDWEKNRILVHSPKTEHHDGGDCRFVPLFPELRPYLLEVFEQAEEGTEYVITRCRDSKTNLRTQMERIIKRAGREALAEAVPQPAIHPADRADREVSRATSSARGWATAGRWRRTITCK